VYPGTGVLQTYLWNNGVSQNDFYTSQNGWGFLTSYWENDDTLSVTVCNETPNILTVEEFRPPLSSLINLSTMGPYQSVTAVSPDDDFSMSWPITIKDQSGTTVVSFTVNMEQWGDFHASKPWFSLLYTSSGYNLSVPLCNAGDVSDGYSSAAQITITYTNS
jgi:hypothetical protein